MQTDEVEKVFIPIFLGKRGGGEQLYLQTTNDFEKYSIKNIPVTSIEVYSRHRIQNALVFYVPHKFKDLSIKYNILSNWKPLVKLFKHMKTNNFAFYLLQIMPSPFDLFFDFFAKRKKITIIRCIHDLRPHTGEIWPTNRAIKRRIRNADVLVTFSDSIRKELSEITSKLVLRADLPDKIFPEHPTLINRVKCSKQIPKLVILGRAKAYKGFETLAAALPIVKSKYEFYAFGEGVYPDSLKAYGTLHNHWQTDFELGNALNLADIIIFPYIEASQSGLIPIAKGLNKFIIFSDIPGLIEQVDTYSNSIMFAKGNVHALASAIENAIHQVSTKPDFENETPIASHFNNSLATVVKNYVEKV